MENVKSLEFSLSIGHTQPITLVYKYNILLFCSVSSSACGVSEILGPSELLRPWAHEESQAEGK